jgi:hypothetical protein
MPRATATDGCGHRLAISNSSPVDGRGGGEDAVVVVGVALGLHAARALAVDGADDRRLVLGAGGEVLQQSGVDPALTVQGPAGVQGVADTGVGGDGGVAVLDRRTQPETVVPGQVGGAAEPLEAAVTAALGQPGAHRGVVVGGRGG